MNDKVKELLEQYNRELFKMGVNPVPCQDVCGMTGVVGLEDPTIQMSHISWMVRQLLDESEGWSETKVNRWLGFVQGVLWCTKLRGILELRDESRDLYAE